MPPRVPGRLHRRERTVRSFRHPLAGIDGDVLHTDVATLGDPEAPAVLFVVSGTHGVEGLCGSGIQTALLSTGAFREVSKHVRMVLVHALNPCGFSWLRRINEDGVDVNRNFIDFHLPAPQNVAFREVAELLVPERWEDLESADRDLARMEALWGRRKTRDVIARGQYTHPRSVHYGGRQPTWSNWILRQTVRDHCPGAACTVLMDIHSGLGPRGRGQMIVSHRESSAALARARAWWGNRVVAVNASDSAEYTATGSLLDAFESEAAEAHATCAALEFGTNEFSAVWNAIRADQWLYSYGSTIRCLDSPGPEWIRTQVRDAFYPDTRSWCTSVWEQAEDIIRITCKELTQ